MLKLNSIRSAVGDGLLVCGLNGGLHLTLRLVILLFVLGDVSVLVSTGPIIENKRVQVGLCDSSLEVGHSNVSAGASEAERLQRQSHLDVGKHDWHTGEGEVPVSNQLMGL